jgi:hypothetical protein
MLVYGKTTLSRTGKEARGEKRILEGNPCREGGYTGVQGLQTNCVGRCGQPAQQGSRAPAEKDCTPGATTVAVLDNFALCCWKHRDGLAIEVDDELLDGRSRGHGLDLDD